jgi:hypothetical protein
MYIPTGFISSNIHDILNRGGKAELLPPAINNLINVLLFFCHSFTIYLRIAAVDRAFLLARNSTTFPLHSLRILNCRSWTKLQSQQAILYPLRLGLTHTVQSDRFSTSWRTNLLTDALPSAHPLHPNYTNGPFH